jgi:hypothetical protein
MMHTHCLLHLSLPVFCGDEQQQTGLLTPGVCMHSGLYYQVSANTCLFASAVSAVPDTRHPTLLFPAVAAGLGELCRLEH